LVNLRKGSFLGFWEFGLARLLLGQGSQKLTHLLEPFLKKVLGRSWPGHWFGGWKKPELGFGAIIPFKGSY